MSGVSVRDDDGIHTLDQPDAPSFSDAAASRRTCRCARSIIGPLVGAAKVRGTPYNQGDGLRLAMNQMGAMPWGQWSGCHATPISADWGNFAPRAS